MSREDEGTAVEAPPADGPPRGALIAALVVAVAAVAAVLAIAAVRRPRRGRW